MDTLYRYTITTQALITATRERLQERVDAARGDDRGEVTSTTITIALLAALAIGVGAIITAKVTEKANAIPTD